MVSATFESYYIEQSRQIGSSPRCDCPTISFHYYSHGRSDGTRPAMAENRTHILREPAREEFFPPGLHNAYLFSTFNAFSFQVVLNSPMVLYAKTLGASATVLGIIAGMMPLLVIFQIPAASYIPRLGFKRFVYAGWGTRVMFIFVMALVPL